MKILWIAGTLALVSLSCRREEETGSVKATAGSLKPSATSIHAADEPTPGTPDTKATKTSERPATPEKKIWVAEPVADKPGYVKSPFSGTIIDVRGIPAGTLVADPTFPAAEKKHFRVPEIPGDPTEILDPSIQTDPDGNAVEDP